jgi:hypothetical protein
VDLTVGNLHILPLSDAPGIKTIERKIEPSAECRKTGQTGDHTVNIPDPGELSADRPDTIKKIILTSRQTEARDF